MPERDSAYIGIRCVRDDILYSPMRHVSFPLVLILLLLLQSPHAGAQARASSVFTINLSLGSSGAQVVALQKILNQALDTRIASAGPGSPGNETGYFGALTKAAVVRFQEKYANEVLVPAGLARGNGRVGLYTRVKLNELSASTSAVSAVGANTSVTQVAQSAPEPTTISTSVTQSVTQPATTSTPVVPSSQAFSVSTTVPQNPNLVGLDEYLVVLEKVAVKQGYSAAAIATMKEGVRKQAATTTDMRATFLKMVQNKSNKSAKNDSLIGKALATIEQAFGRIFIPERARAAPVLTPFGGLILYASPCDGGIWNIELTPLPPAFPVLLSYMSGSQAFLSYNIPLPDIWLLGMYEPVPMAYCWVGIVPYPSEGLITSDVGSSPTP